MKPMKELTVSVNGDPVDLTPGSTIADVVNRLVPGGESRGIAVAVDRCVVPRSEWGSTVAEAGSRIEVVTAAAGG